MRGLTCHPRLRLLAACPTLPVNFPLPVERGRRASAGHGVAELPELFFFEAALSCSRIRPFDAFGAHVSIFVNNFQGFLGPL